jgi:hypothetical protein
MDNICVKLHHIANSAYRYNFKTGFVGIPKNGIYIMFEKGEYAHEADRIVRIGTHTGDNQLPSRIRQHFINENKNRSIFRKNVGRCILNNHSYAEKWEYDTTSRADKNKYLRYLDLNFEKEVEKQISQFIQDNLSFAIITVNDKNERLQLESRLIGTVSICNECKPSTKWFGSKSPLAKIRQSGLWQVQGLYGDVLTNLDIEFISKAMENGT